MQQVTALQTIEREHKIEMDTFKKAKDLNQLAVEQQLDTVKSVNSQLQQKLKVIKPREFMEIQQRFTKLQNNVDGSEAIYKNAISSKPNLNFNMKIEPYKLDE